MSLWQRSKSWRSAAKAAAIASSSVPSMVNSKGYEYVVPVNPDDCIGCCICGRMCPDGAIEIYK